MVQQAIFMLASEVQQEAPIHKQAGEVLAAGQVAHPAQAAAGREAARSPSRRPGAARLLDMSFQGGMEFFWELLRRRPSRGARGEPITLQSWSRRAQPTLGTRALQLSDRLLAGGPRPPWWSCFWPGFVGGGGAGRIRTDSGPRRKGRGLCLFTPSAPSTRMPDRTRTQMASTRSPRKHSLGRPRGRWP